jgi:chemotaxis protein MotB
MEHEVPEMEMIIIKRGHAQEEHPHGGAWKVAFADFMTAMMAFFLVLWIVNSTNKETRSSVARYFNPIRISDTTAARKGLKDPKEADFDASTSSEEKQKTRPAGGALDEAMQGGGAQDAGPGGHEKLLAGSGEDVDPFISKEPFAALAELATRAGISGRPVQVELTYEVPQQFRDPFAPPAPVVPPEMRPMMKPVTGERSRASGQADGKADQQKEAALASDQGRANRRDPKLGEAPSGEMKSGEAEQAAKDAKLADSRAQAQALREQIAQALKNAGLSEGPKLEVRSQDEGILISLTDDLNFVMFKIGSAEPQPLIVRAMEQIGDILRAQKGTFVLRGHTDSRPYRTPAYDNWRLSAARAQTAAYMLIRGKLEEKRIERVEGHADRSPKNVADPLAPENRRIEILLRRPS